MKIVFSLRGNIRRPLNKADAKGQLTWRDRQLLSSVHGKEIFEVAFGSHIR